jgi:hypothetical protein
VRLGAAAARTGRRLKVRIRLSGFDAVCRMVESGISLAALLEMAARSLSSRRKSGSFLSPRGGLLRATPFAFETSLRCRLMRSGSWNS